MPCTGRFATAEDYNRLMCAAVDLNDPEAVSDIEAALDLAASDIHIAMAAVGACDCTLTTYAEKYLAKLNVVDAAVLQNCPCGNALDAQARSSWLEWLNLQFDLIRAGKVPLCQGETGAEFPAFGHAEQALTDFTAEQIVVNRRARHSV